jgi:predicted DNA-binding transcriptional regulator YafY
MAGGYHLFESGDQLCRALFKLEAALPEEYRADVTAVRERMLFDSAAWHHRPAESTPYLEAIRGAVWGGRQLDILYSRYDGSGWQWRRVEPYGLVFKAGVWYLVAFCQMRQDFRTFRVGRIQDMAVREEPVTPRPDFDLQTYWEEARERFEGQTLPFALTLRVAPPLLHRATGAVTVLRREPGGSAVIRVALESRESAISYVLRFGSGATIVDPEDLRAAVAAEARALAELYEDPVS